MRKNKELRVMLKGGLGNQLFGYFAVLYLSNVTGRKPVILCDEIDIARTNYHHSISSFNLDARVEKSWSRISSFNLRVVRKTKKSCPYVSNILRKVTGVVLEEKSNLPEIGLELQASASRRIITLDGYFQDLSYFSLLDNDLKELDIKECSDWFRVMEDKIREADPIVIHVRLGDYLGNLAAIGVLSGEYYLHALQRIPNFRQRQIWIFSDDISKTRKLLSYIDIPNCVFVCPPIDCDPAESLKIMSYSNDLIISNSTFSIWAAMIGRRKAIVVAPDVFYRGSSYTPNNIPENWELERSQWLNEAI